MAKNETNKIRRNNEKKKIQSGKYFYFFDFVMLFLFKKATRDDKEINQR